MVRNTKVIPSGLGILDGHLYRRVKGLLCLPVLITIEAAADRLAAQISDEAITFSRSQLGWDATARTINGLVQQVRRRIDEGVIYKALAAVHTVPSNSGGTWTPMYTASYPSSKSSSTETILPTTILHSTFTPKRSRKFTSE